MSIKIGAVCFVLHLLSGLVIGRYLACSKSVFALILDIIVTIPLVFPPVAIGFLLLVLLGKNGVFGQLFTNCGVEMLFSFKALVLASYIAGLPLVVKPVQAAFQSQTKFIEEASYTLGKGKISTFLFVSVPCIKNTIISSIFLSFARSVGEVGITLLIGGNIIGKTETISLAIYNATLSAEYGRAAFFSAVLGSVSLIIFLVTRKIQKEG